MKVLMLMVIYLCLIFLWAIIAINLSIVANLLSNFISHLIVFQIIFENDVIYTYQILIILNNYYICLIFLNKIISNIKIKNLL